MSTDNEETDLSKASTALIDDFVSSNPSSNEVTDGIPKLPDEKIRKPFLGGYRNKSTGVTYLHVATQTIKPPWNYGMNELFHRDSQTVDTKDEIQQTMKDAAAQVEVRNIYIQTSNDKFCIPSPPEKYQSADEIESDYLSKVIFVQRYVRRWLAVKEVKRRQQDLLAKLLWEKEQRKKREKQDSDFLKDLRRRKLYPINEEDFLLLFSDLQNWWNNEADIISQNKTGPEQQEAFCTLVIDESKKISDIDKIKIEVEKTKKFHQRQSKLMQAGKPKQWKAYKTEIPVINDHTYKSKRMNDLYMTLTMEHITTQDRIDALQSLIYLLQQHKNNLTNSLLDLAQREIDLLLRGTKVQNLKGLRSRIQNLLWQYVRQPIFNPEMKYQPQLQKMDGKNPFIPCCAGCKQFYTLPPNTANEVTSKSVMGNCFLKCENCIYLQNEGWIRKDIELFKKILQMLIAEEKKKTSVSGIILSLQ